MNGPSSALVEPGVSDATASRISSSEVVHLLEADLHASHRISVGVTRDLEGGVAVVSKVAARVEVDAGGPRHRPDAGEIPGVLLGQRAGADQPVEE